MGLSHAPQAAIAQHLDGVIASARILVGAQGVGLESARVQVEALQAELAAALARIGALQGTITQTASSAYEAADVAATGRRERKELTEQVARANEECAGLRAALSDVAAKHADELRDAASRTAALAMEQRKETDAAVAEQGRLLHDARSDFDAKHREFVAQAATADSLRSALVTLEVMLQSTCADADKALADEVRLACPS